MSDAIHEFEYRGTRWVDLRALAAAAMFPGLGPLWRRPVSAAPIIPPPPPSPASPQQLGGIALVYIEEHGSNNDGDQYVLTESTLGEFVVRYFGRDLDIVRPQDQALFRGRLYGYEPGNVAVELSNNSGKWCFPIEWVTKVLPPKAQQLEPRNERYPHRCPLCKADAYIGFTRIECSSAGCTHHRR